MMLLEQERSRLRYSSGEILSQPQRCVVINQGRLTPKWPENMKSQISGSGPFYHDCGQFYCSDVRKFQEQKVIWMKDVVPFIQDESTVQDIDTLEDWKIAEMKYQIMHQK